MRNAILSLILAAILASPALADDDDDSSTPNVVAGALAVSGVAAAIISGR